MMMPVYLRQHYDSQVVYNRAMYTALRYKSGILRGERGISGEQSEEGGGRRVNFWGQIELCGVYRIIDEIIKEIKENKRFYPSLL